MSTNIAPPPPTGPAAPVDNTAAIKGADSALQAVAVLYRQCHAIDPDGPICEAVQNIIRAMSEIARHIEQFGGITPTEPEAAAPPEGEMPMEEEPPIEPTPTGPGFDGAAGGLHQAMIQDAMRRKRPPL